MKPSVKRSGARVGVQGMQAHPQKFYLSKVREKFLKIQTAHSLLITTRHSPWLELRI